jgi:ABC-type transport system involved in multi-copper enzyme maturation permease subunit
VRAWPLGARELLVQSRLARTHASRTAGGLLLAVGAAAFLPKIPSSAGPIQIQGTLVWVSQSDGFPGRLNSMLSLFENRGGVLFAIINLLILGTIWLIAPLLTADALSHERRQGTLGMLFLAPLRARDIVFSKFVVHGLQAWGVFVAGLPLLMIPVILGGMTWMDWVRAILLDVGALVLALSVGLLASSSWQGARAVVVGALCMSLLAALLWATGWAVMQVVAYPAGVETHNSVTAFLAAVTSHLLAIWQIATSVLHHRESLLFLPGTASVSGVSELLRPAMLFLGALVLAVGAMSLAVFRTRRALSEGSADREMMPGGATKADLQWWREFRGGMEKRIRSRSPMFWVEMRTWRGQILPWLTLLVLLPLESWRVFQPATIGESPLSAPAWLLTLALALAAASCLQVERALGILDLMTTIPLGVRRVLVGKVAGLGAQCLPAVIVLLAMETSRLAGPWSEESVWWTMFATGVALCGRLAVTAAAGILAGLCIKSLLLAWAVTLSLVAIIAGISEVAASVTPETFATSWSNPLVAGLLEMLLAIVFGFGIRRKMTESQSR